MPPPAIAGRRPFPRRGRLFSLFLIVKMPERDPVDRDPDPERDRRRRRLPSSVDEFSRWPPLSRSSLSSLSRSLLSLIVSQSSPLASNYGGSHLRRRDRPPPVDTLTAPFFDSSSVAPFGSSSSSSSRSQQPPDRSKATTTTPMATKFWPPPHQLTTPLHSLLLPYRSRRSSPYFSVDQLQKHPIAVALLLLPRSGRPHLIASPWPPPREFTADQLPEFY